MKAAITQPNYIPWLGYFDLLNEVDLFVALDNVQFVKRSVIVRNKIKAPNGDAKWLTVNLKSFSREDNINEVYLDETEWYKSHAQKIEAYYQKAPYFKEYYDEIVELLRPRENDKVLADYNIRILKSLSSMLGIKVDIVKASDYMDQLSGSPEEKILNLCEKLEVRHYYNFKKGVEVGLYHVDNFTDRGIKLIKQDYEHPTYNQLNGDFLPYMSILDLLFNEGDSSLEIIKKGSNWETQN